MCQVLVNRITLKDFQALIDRIWGFADKIEAMYFNKGWFYVRFNNKRDLEDVMKKGPWYSQSYPILVKK